MHSIVVLRQADQRRDGPIAPWDVDPALLELLRTITEDAASAGTGARLVMALPHGTPETLVSAHCHRRSWRAWADLVLERGEAVQSEDLVAALVEGPRGLRGVFLLYGADFDARAVATVRAYAGQVQQALDTSEARRDAARQTAEALVQALAAHDAETARHSHAIRRLALVLGRAYGLAPHDLQVLDRAALLHDFGKIHIPPAVLCKDGPLAQGEWAMMRQHPAQGEAILRAIPDLADCAATVRHHHERWDGAGYPDRLSGATIPIGARIIALVDAYEVMRIGRIYRPSRSRDEALAELAAHAGTQFDPRLYQVLADIPYHTLGL